MRKLGPGSIFYIVRRTSVHDPGEALVGEFVEQAVKADIIAPDAQSNFINYVVKADKVFQAPEEFFGMTPGKIVVVQDVPPRIVTSVTTEGSVPVDKRAWVAVVGAVALVGAFWFVRRRK
jgi:hypothetical protein